MTTISGVTTKSADCDHHHWCDLFVSQEWGGGEISDFAGHIAVHNNRGADLLVGPEIVAHAKLLLNPERKAWGVGPPPTSHFCLRGGQTAS